MLPYELLLTLKKDSKKNEGRPIMPMSVFISVSKIPFKINHVKVNGNKWPKMRILITDYSNIHARDHL